MVGTMRSEESQFHPSSIVGWWWILQGAKIVSDTVFPLLREIGERFGILGPLGSELEDTRSWVRRQHTQLQWFGRGPRKWRLVRLTAMMRIIYGSILLFTLALARAEKVCRN